MKCERYVLDKNTAGIKLHGDLDIDTVPRTEETLFRILDEGFKNVVLDFEDVRYMDSCGVIMLVHVLQRVGQSQGKVVLVGMNSRVRELLQITGLIHEFAVYSDHTRALLSLGLPHKGSRDLAAHVTFKKHRLNVGERRAVHEQKP
jgi:anti-sigma B factor antagonist